MLYLSYSVGAVHAAVLVHHMVASREHSHNVRGLDNFGDALLAPPKKTIVCQMICSS